MNKLTSSLLFTAVLTACGQGATESSTSMSVAPAAAASENTVVKTIDFSLGDEQWKFPIAMCTITPAFVVVAGNEGETKVDLTYEGRPKVSYRHHFERDGTRYWNQWDSRRDDIEYATSGSTVTASGTMQNTNRWKEGTQNGWVNVTGSEPLADQPFTFSATCN